METPWNGVFRDKYIQVMRKLKINNRKIIFILKLFKNSVSTEDARQWLIRSKANHESSKNYVKWDSLHLLQGTILVLACQQNKTTVIWAANPTLVFSILPSDHLFFLVSNISSACSLSMSMFSKHSTHSLEASTSSVKFTATGQRQSYMYFIMMAWESIFT
jgi:hypothetical protein